MKSIQTDTRLLALFPLFPRDCAQPENPGEEIYPNIAVVKIRYRQPEYPSNHERMFASLVRSIEPNRAQALDKFSAR